MKEAKLQTMFTRWLVADSNGGVCVHKISDLSPEKKPFDCFAIGFEPGSWFWERGYVACGFELKVPGKSGSGRIAYSQIKEHQILALYRCTGSGSESLGSGTGGYFVFGFGSGADLRVFVIDVDDVAEAKSLGKRGSFDVEWCEKYGDEIKLKVEG